MPIHKDLPDSELHPPKGFLPASNESFPIKNASGLIEWISTSNLGSKWHTGAGLPSPALGRTGDFYLDSDVGDFYEKVNFNTWTLRGNVDGSDWFKGSGPPNSALGRIQDFYIDIDEGDIYEKSAPTVWDLITNIDGSDWFQGAGPPALSLGREQDFYIDKSNGDLYEKTSPTAWTSFGNIRGPQGIPGPLANLVEDTTPELGGNLDGNGHDISNVGTYNGVNVQNHESRHRPGGSDALPTAAPVNQTPDQANAQGISTSFARSDHVHDIPTASAVGLDANSSNTQGSNPSFARSNHTHAIAFAAPSTQTPDQANAPGVAAPFAKADHTHNVPTAPAVGLDANSTNTQGSNPSFARSNHTHSIGTGTPVTQLPAQANNVGSSPNLARADHIHNLPTAVPLTVGTANSEGTANSFARSDHIHSHGNQAGGLLHALVTQALTGFMSAVDKLKLDQINIAHLSYSNSGTITTTSNTFVNVSIDVDRESFSNSLFTKVNATDFQTNFAGQVEIGYRLMAFPSANDLGWEIGIQRNSTDIAWSAVASNAKNTINRRDTPSASVILNCAVNDIFRLRLRSIEGATITVNPDFAYMSIRVYRINP